MLRKLNLLAGLALLAFIAAPAVADPPVVCRVTAEGEVICDPVIGPTAAPGPKRPPKVAEIAKLLLD